MNALAGYRDVAGEATSGDDSARFLGLITQHLAESHGQYFQDVAALLFCGDAPGFFVEVGTGNGTVLSNTHLLERRFGWRGLLVEPDRRFHDSIRASRTAHLEIRPACRSDGEQVEFLEVDGIGELSTLSRYRSMDGWRRRGQVRTIDSITLNSALEQVGAPQRLDYVSIDTEGSELEVLDGLDLDRYDVRFMTIEHNFVPGRREAIIDRLSAHGFRPVLEPFSHMDVWLAKGEAFADEGPTTATRASASASIEVRAPACASAKAPVALHAEREEAPLPDADASDSGFFEPPRLLIRGWLRSLGIYRIRRLDDLDAVVISPGGVGSTLLIDAISPFIRVNSRDDADHLKHLPRLPSWFPTEMKVIFVHGAVDDIVHSIRRRGWVARHGSKLGSIASVLAGEEGRAEALRRAVEQQIAWFVESDRPNLLRVRYENLWDRLDEIATFLGIDGKAFRENFPPRQPRTRSASPPEPSAAGSPA